MGDEWFFGPRRKRRTSSLKTSTVVLAILVIANVGLMGFFLFKFNLNNSKLNQEIERLSLEIDSLQYQLADARQEVSSLRDEISMIELGNASPSLPLTQIYNQTKRSVVLISVRTRFAEGQGSGFVYDREGRIITNNHVVDEAIDITVTFIDGTIISANIVGRDPFSDLAIIDVDIPEFLLKPLRLGKSSELLVGEMVVAIGNPVGLADTMTTGIVSAVERELTAPGGYPIVDVIQTDAAINPGNSGGPLLNLKGEVIGMNTAIIEQTQGIGFAIPSDTIKREVKDLIDKGVFEHAWLGISGGDFTPEMAGERGLDENFRGAFVVSVTKDGPADKGGLEGDITDGDIIIGIDGYVIRRFYDLSIYLVRHRRPGDTIKVTAIREGEITELEIVLGIRPPP